MVGKSTSQIHVGDLVYLLAEHDKTQPRNGYLVVFVDKPRCFVRTFSGNPLRALAFKVRISECHLIPSQVPKIPPSRTTDTDSEDDVRSPNSPFQPTNIPPVLTLPSSQLSPHTNSQSCSPADDSDLNSRTSRLPRDRLPPKYFEYELVSSIVQTKGKKRKKKTTPQLALLCYCYIKVTVRHAYNDVVLISISNILKLHEICHIGRNLIDTTRTC